MHRRSPCVAGAHGLAAVRGTPPPTSAGRRTPQPMTSLEPMDCAACGAAAVQDVAACDGIAAAHVVAAAHWAVAAHGAAAPRRARARARVARGTECPRRRGSGCCRCCAVGASPARRRSSASGRSSVTARGGRRRPRRCRRGARRAPGRRRPGRGRCARGGEGNEGTRSAADVAATAPKSSPGGAQIDAAPPPSAPRVDAKSCCRSHFPTCMHRNMALELSLVCACGANGRAVYFGLLAHA